MQRAWHSPSVLLIMVHSQAFHIILLQIPMERTPPILSPGVMLAWADLWVNSGNLHPLTQGLFVLFESEPNLIKTEI